jgi:hypothetical protein
LNDGRLKLPTADRREWAFSLANLAIPSLPFLFPRDAVRYHSARKKEKRTNLRMGASPRLKWQGLKSQIE